MVGIAQPNRANPVDLGSTDCFFRSHSGQNLSHCVLAIDDSDSSSIDDDFRVGDGIANAGFEACGIPRQAQNSVRLMAPQISLHERICCKFRVCFRHANSHVNCCRECVEWSRKNFLLAFHMCPRMDAFSPM